MTLKKQLLVVGALTLLIPLAGIQFVLQLEEALRAQELQRLSEQAARIAQTVEQALPTQIPGQPRRTVFVESFSRRLILDGYGDDWPNRPGEDGEPLLYSAGEQVLWRAAQDADNLWLFLEFPRLRPVFAQPDAAHGLTTAPDRLILSWQTPDGELQERLVEARGPGRALVRRYGSQASQGRGEASASSVDAVWQTRGDGFAIELKLPGLPSGSQFGFSLEHARDGGPAQSFGTLGRKAAASDGDDLPLLLVDLPAVNALLAQFLTPGQSLTLISPEGWQLAQATAPVPEQNLDVTLISPLELLQRATLQALRLLLSANRDPGPQLAPDGALWQGSPLQTLEQLATPRTRLVLEATHRSGEAPALTIIAPVGNDAYLISRRSTEALLSLSSATLGQVLARSILFTLTLVLVLVGYASWLSWRISRLQRSVSGVFDSDGRVTGSLASSDARDELGELSRNFSHLVTQVRGYTNYLESFARKLSHELKTPLAVMRSSLDNLSHTDPSPAQTVYLERASDGGERLSRILTVMSEATRLERSLTRTEKETFDLTAVLAMAAAGYQGVDSRVRYRGPNSPCLMLGAPDLLVQGLDKLVENARDFTPAEGQITVTLEPGAQHWTLSVCNDGPLLPDHMSEHIFGSFVSVRPPGGDNGHLGQGLVIVKLVADFHQARVVAENRADGCGVCFRLFLPRQTL